MLDFWLNYIYIDNFCITWDYCWHGNKSTATWDSLENIMTTESAFKQLTAGMTESVRSTYKYPVEVGPKKNLIT